MSILTFLGIDEITEEDNYGRIHLRLAIDLLREINQHSTELIIKEKARNIIQVCCEPEFDDMIECYQWSPAEVDYADMLLAQGMEIATREFMAIAMRRITHTRKKERRIKLQIEDFRLAAMMSFIMNVHNVVIEQLEAEFIKEHGSLYFDS